LSGILIEKLNLNAFKFNILVALPNYNDHKFDPPQIVFPGYDILPLPLNTEYQNKTIDELSFLKHKDMSDLWKKFIDSVPMSKTRMAHIPKNKYNN